MFRALQIFGAAIMGLMMSKGALEIAGAASSRGSLTYVLILIAFTPVVILAMIGMATGSSARLLSNLGHQQHNDEG